jgi:hypothetical protein
MPQETIYLDDARIGRFRPQARKLHQRFLELVADAPSSRDVWNFLLHGSESLSSDNFPHNRGLRAWQGVDHFREVIAKSISDADVAPRDIYFAGRSRSLMSLGAKMLSRRCSRVLSVDMNWPVYQHELSEIAKQVDCNLSVAKIQNHIIAERWDVDDLVECLSQSYERSKCDGLFLPAVDSMGIRLPITEIVERLRSKQEVRFVLVDAAQAIGHTDLSEIAGVADFIVAGTHKWVGSYIPLGVGIALNPSSQQWIANFLKAAIGINGAGDSLSHMLHSVDNRCDSRFPETVNLGGLIAGFGAWTSTPSPRNALAMRIANADRIAAIAEFNGWDPIRPDEAMRSGSLVLQSKCHQTRNRCFGDVRNSFADSGIILSTYATGIIRMAMPETLIPTEQVLRIQDALFDANNSRRIAC